MNFFSKTLINKIEKTNENLVKLAVNKARKQNHLSFNKSLDVNFIKSYSKIIKKFSKSKTLFDKGQLDTKLAPY